MLGGRVRRDEPIWTLLFLQLKQLKSFRRVKIDVHLGSNPCLMSCTNSSPGIGLLGWRAEVGGYQRNSIPPGIAGIWGIGQLEPGPFNQFAWRDLLTASIAPFRSFHCPCFRFCREAEARFPELAVILFLPSQPHLPPTSRIRTIAAGHLLRPSVETKPPRISASVAQRTPTPPNERTDPRMALLSMPRD